MKTAGGALQDDREAKKPRISTASDPATNNINEQKTFELLCGSVSGLSKAMEDEEPVSLRTAENGEGTIDTLGLPKTPSGFFDKETKLYLQSQQILIKGDKTPQHSSKDLDELGSKTRVEIPNIDNYSAAVSKLLASFDAIWQGEGGSEAGLMICPPGALIPGRRSTCHQLIIQIEGEQFVKFSSVGYEYEESEGVLHEPAILEEVGSKVGLSSGSIQYVPPFFVKESTVVGSTPSISLHIYFAAKIQFDDLLQISLQKAEEDLLTVPDKDDLAVKPLAQAQFVLQRAFDLAPSVYQSALARTLSRHQFNVTHNVNLVDLLEKNNGFIKIDNFLPVPVAESIYSSLLSVNDREWKGQFDEDDEAHEFLSSPVFPNSRAIFEIFQNICPDKQSHFSAAKYLEGHFMSEHDDTETSHVAEGNIYSRTIAVVYHVSKNWKEEYGGVFVDATSDPPKKYVPEFNSLVAFQVPRRHFVEAVKNHGPRYSIYGWFHQFDRECSHEEISISSDSDSD